MGSAYTTVNADALARWHRLLGEETKFITGTDEHGQKVADAALKSGSSPQAWVDQTSARFVEAWDALAISYDDFIRTTEPRHYLSVQKFLTAIYENGYIYKDVYQGLYCVSCEDYFTYESSDEGKCPIHGRALIEMEEENWFFRLSAFEDRDVYKRQASVMASGSSPSRWRLVPPPSSERVPGLHEPGRGLVHPRLGRTAALQGLSLIHI